MSQKSKQPNEGQNGAIESDYMNYSRHELKIISKGLNNFLEHILDEIEKMEKKHNVKKDKKQKEKEA